ncbi:MAG: TolC family protein [Planctomycetota bacterium]
MIGAKLERAFASCEYRPVTRLFRTLCAATVVALLIVLTGCRTPSKHRLDADKVAADIIQQKQMQALGQTSQFSIERPSDILRRRLLLKQNLPYSSQASLGTDKLKTIEHWPEDDYPQAQSSLEPILLLETGKAPQLSLVQALQIGARNSFEYQTLKENIFQAALDLDLERNEFRNIFAGQVDSLISTDTTGGRTVSGTEFSGTTGMSRMLKSGAELTTALAIDLANLMTAGGASSFGIATDATIAIPLLRGSGKHIVTEPLTQAERNVVYAIYDFERFKQTFAVQIASQYLGVLRQLDQIKNAEENYRRAALSARRSRRFAEAGRLSQIQVDQAVQSELRARNRWIIEAESYKSALDSFKSLLGLPPDARMDLDRAELEQLTAPASKIMADIIREEEAGEKRRTPPADAPIELAPPSREDAGPLEIEESSAIELALDNRLDLRVAEGQVYDAQRAVVVAADALGTELTLFGTSELGSRRSISSATADDAQLRTDKGKYSALLTFDLPFERTAERNAYRNSFILLERAVRDVQILEDQIKLDVRNQLRDLLESRESLKIQANSVIVAERRVKSSNLFFEAGEVPIRDVLEAQDALLSAQNALTSAVVSYRVAELELQIDMGLLKVDEKGLWQEYSPKENKNVKE